MEKHIVMRSNLRTIGCAVLLLCTCGCIYSNFRLPASRDFRNTQTVSRSGVSTSHSIAWIAAWGDGGLQAAAENGNLKTLEYVDYQFLNVLFGLYMNRKTIVYGQ
jgi:hypothetical protein